MKIKSERELMMDLMSRAIKDKDPNMVIRRLQDDKAFAIYSKVQDGRLCKNPYYYYILIDVITQKINPDHFNTINNLIRFYNDLDKGINIPMQYHLKDMFHPIIIKDNKDNVLEKLIKFDYQEFCTIGSTMTVDNYITEDDEYNLISILHKCTEFIRDNKNIANLSTTNNYLQNRFEFALTILDEYASKDEVLIKAITEDLYGCKIFDCECKVDTDYYANIYTKSNKILIKHKCPSCEREIIHPDDFTLYYTGVPLLHWKVNHDTNEISNIKDVFTKYLKGSYDYRHFKFDNPDKENYDYRIFQKYLIPILWFDFEEISYIDTKLVNIRCNDCGESLAVIG